MPCHCHWLKPLITGMAICLVCLTGAMVVSRDPLGSPPSIDVPATADGPPRIEANYDLDKEYRWSTGAASSTLVRGEYVDRIRHDIHMLICAVNESDQDPESFRTPAEEEPVTPPKIRLLAVKGDVIHVEVINGEYLTQRMGSSGANELLAIATFTLTEYDHARFVHFHFEEGDQAIPGLYSRADFLDRWQVSE
ncbi:MAG: hypothetical protein JXQ27_18795 [Acidobacteria bacterium]|nr:hypothetical protein [Acidobacteriota bacterium]